MDLTYKSPSGKSDHIVLLFGSLIQGFTIETPCTHFKYRKVDYPSIMKYLNSIQWSELLLGQDISDSYCICENVVKELVKPF